MTITRQKGRTEEQKEINPIRPQRKYFLCDKGDIWQNTVSLYHLMQ